MTNNTTATIVTQGQRFKSLHTPDDCSAPFFVLYMVASLVWMPMSLANENGAAMLPAQIRHLGLSMVGEGTTTWLGFSIYKASLWTQNGTYYETPVKQGPDLHQAIAHSLPIALHIVYEKNISSDT